MTQPRKLHVFLCHASQDKPIVRELYERLLSEGWIDPWLDEEKLLPGQDWDLEIEKTVESADAVIVCLSHRSINKEGYLQKELRKVLDAADRKPEGTIFIIPLRLEDCQPPHRLQAWHYVDYFPDHHRDFTYERMMRSLKSRAGVLGIPVEETLMEAGSDQYLHQLRMSLGHETILYQLSQRVSQSDEISDAATIVAETAKELTNAAISGIVLFSSDKQVYFQMRIDSNGAQPSDKHPFDLISQSMDTKQIVILSQDETFDICLPILTTNRIYGALWLEFPQLAWDGSYGAVLSTLVNQAAIALERNMLLADARNQAGEIERAYRELETVHKRSSVEVGSSQNNDPSTSEAKNKRSKKTV